MGSINKKVFYGWWVLAALCSIYAVVNGIVTLSLKRFYPSFIESFGWSEAEVTQPISLFYFVIAFLTPFVGAALDRGNPKRIILAGALIVIMGLVGMNYMTNLGQFMAIYIAFSFGVAGAGLASAMYILVKWFKQHRGKAIGLLLVGGSLGAAFFNKVTGEGIDAFGWRNTTLVLAGLAAIFMILPWFIIKNTPQEMGLFPDGSKESSNNNSSQESDGITLSQAFKTPELYLIFVATGTLWFCIIGFGQHQDIFLQNELRLSTTVVTNVGSTLFLFGVVGKLLFGFLSDKFNKKAVMASSVAMLIVGNILLYVMATSDVQLSPYLYALTYGIAYSGVFTMIQVIVAEIYHGKAYGKILGLVLTIDTLASVAGILVLGKLNGQSGSYVSGILTMIVLCTFSFVMLLFIKLRPKVSQSSEGTMPES